MIPLPKLLCSEYNNQEPTYKLDDDQYFGNILVTNTITYLITITSVENKLDLLFIAI